MTISATDIYGSVAEGDAYFADRLHSEDWTTATSDNKLRALLAATRDIDLLLYSGVKNPVYDLITENPRATVAEIAAADATQLHEFPRNGDATVPKDIEYATYEIAIERLSGRNPDCELGNLELTSDGSGSTRLTYDRLSMPMQHKTSGIISFTAWRMLQPYLDMNNTFVVTRVN